MHTLYEVAGQTLNNRDLTFTNRTTSLAAGSVIIFRLRVTALNPNSTMAVVMNITFPDGKVKRFELFVNQVGSYQRGGWRGTERGGQISASGSITVEGRITFDAAIVTFEQGEDVSEWS